MVIIIICTVPIQSQQGHIYIVPIQSQQGHIYIVPMQLHMAATTMIAEFLSVMKLTKVYNSETRMTAIVSRFGLAVRS